MGPFSREQAIADVTTALTRPYFALTVAGVDDRLLPLLDRLTWTDLGERLAAALTSDRAVDK